MSAQNHPHSQSGGPPAECINFARFSAPAVPLLSWNLAAKRGCPRTQPSRPRGRLAQLVRAPALQAGCRGFESLTAHQIPPEIIAISSATCFFSRSATVLRFGSNRTTEQLMSNRPAMKSEEISSFTRQTNYGSWRYQQTWKPLHVADAEGCWLIDGAGKRYLDFSSQLMCVNLGHKNSRVIESIAEQARELAYVMPAYTTAARARLSARLLDVLPAGLEKFFFVTSGTEANEAAFKIARMYTGKNKIISRYRSYHGSTAGAIAATGDPRRWAMEPVGKAQDFVFGPETNCYDCPIGHTYPGCGIACASYIEHMIRNESDVAAVIVEPVVGTNGVLVPPPEYLPRLREICDWHGVLLIDDEVMTGWGRTGKWFCVDHWNVKPDILVTAKGITSAYVPLGLCATTKKIADYFEDHY